jgi:hypothetical protein
MTLQAFEISKATAALRNAAFELPPRKLPWFEELMVFDLLLDVI